MYGLMVKTAAFQAVNEGSIPSMCFMCIIRLVGYGASLPRKNKTGSNPVWCSYWELSQLVESSPDMRDVGGSIPLFPIKR